MDAAPHCRAALDGHAQVTGPCPAQGWPPGGPQESPARELACCHLLLPALAADRAEPKPLVKPKGLDLK